MAHALQGELPHPFRQGKLAPQGFRRVRRGHQVRHGLPVGDDPVLPLGRLQVVTELGAAPEQEQEGQRDGHADGWEGHGGGVRGSGVKGHAIQRGS